MTEIKQELTKKKSIDTLEKVIKIWKTKNNISCYSKLQTKNLRKTDESIMFLGRKISRKQVVPNSLEDITLTAQKLCEEYIEARFVRSGIKEYEQSDETVREEYLHVVQNMGQILELKYPKLYNKISIHLKLSYENEIVVWDAFNKVGSNMFTDGITWAKIIALYAFTGGLALDSMNHGKSELPGRIVYWFGVFVMKRLAAWIQEQGGWKGVVEHFNQKGKFDDDFNDDDDEYTSHGNDIGVIQKIISLIQKHPTRFSILMLFILAVILTLTFS